MQEFHGWTLPARAQQNGFSSQQVPPPRTVYGGYDVPTFSPNHQYYNVPYSPQQLVNVHVVSPPRSTIGASSVGSASPNCSHGYQYQNAHGGQHISTPPRDQAPTLFNATPQTIDNKYYPSPPISQGSWNVPSPESATKTTVEGDYGKAYQTSMTARNISPDSMASNERPITRPTVAVGRGYENIPAFPITQQKHRPVTDIRQESKNRQTKEHMMSRPGIKRLPHMSLEKLATSTRVQKPKPPVPNHQTVNAFKYKIHHDRETIAQSKALSLMNILNPEM